MKPEYGVPQKKVAARGYTSTNDSKWKSPSTTILGGNPVS
jgi:hypothetical protein